ncbi:putative zinc finger protein [Rosellinia necatrix]|uniref:Putative zinc finger protein n=1 Tax=Rosellinia necatrix TaxID=77044 RepID=A0A1W2TQN8_ROSNE|nr:putative zinc finger protein [Rosellinia necatrix]
MFHRPGHEQQDFMLFPDQSTRTGFASPPMDMVMSPNGFGFSRSPQDEFMANPHFDNSPTHADVNAFMYRGRTSPGLYGDECDMRIPASNLSTASAASPSSTVGSPNSNHGQLAFIPEYTTGMNVNPSIVGSGDYFAGTEYAAYTGPGMEDFPITYDSKTTFVDPSLIHPEIRGSMAPPMAAYDHNGYSPQNPYPHSPALSGAASPAPVMRTGSRSPYMHTYHQQFSSYAIPPAQGRRPSISYPSHTSPHEYAYNSDESEKKQRCPHPDCGKTFKDLKAHMLTHQTERPEKCPIFNCEYHVKGFARKYDKNRHTLTHYKGTMVCGFCPGSGSSAEKSFNRADVFKRHLTAVHGVEQTPPNSRKKTSPSASSGKKLTGYAPDATGKCSTCSATFSNAQDFYEHLDDCVLRIVQQEDPAEAINAQRLAEVEDDKEVQQTLEKNQLPLTTQPVPHSEDEEDDEMGDEDELLDEAGQIRKLTSPAKRKNNPANGVQKSRGMTHSRGGVPLSTKSKGRKNRQNYPSSWGFDKGQMTMKKRVLAVFDGPRRLAKDDMMLSTEHEVRVKLSDGKSYVTDLDVNTMKRAEGFLNATPQEKGYWISDDPTEEDMAQMMVHH